MVKEALKQVSILVDRFQQNIEAYQSLVYNETQLRIEFVDPFFEALGWDVANKAGYAEQYKDVIHEDAIKVAGATKAPDYCFRIGGVRKLFLETKKPSVDIKEQTSPAYQLRRYAWSAKLPLSILTNFEELAIYDCRLRPRPTDKPSIGRIRYYTYPQYLDSFEGIHNLLSKESVLKGSFDKFAESDRQKRGTSEVDAEFLKEIESWRETLARTIAARNPKLFVRELNFAVQFTIDRIIFLRMCEDRGIEPYGQLQSLGGGNKAVPHWRFQYGGWKIDFFPIPKSTALRGKPGVRPIGMQFYGFHFVESVSAIRGALIKKAKRYGDLDLPYVIAVNILDYDADRIDFVDALFRNEQFIMGVNPNGIVMEPKMIRKPNGLWYSTNGPRYTRVSAVIFAEHIMPWSLPRAFLCLYHNPWAKKKYSSILTRLPQAIPKGEMEWRQGETVGSILGLPQEWPEG
jgi:hypothetical protein